MSQHYPLLQLRHACGHFSHYQLGEALDDLEVYKEHALRPCIACYINGRQSVDVEDFVARYPTFQDRALILTRPQGEVDHG